MNQFSWLRQYCIPVSNTSESVVSEKIWTNDANLLSRIRIRIHSLASAVVWEIEGGRKHQETIAKTIANAAWTRERERQLPSVQLPLPDGHIDLPTYRLRFSAIPIMISEITFLHIGIYSWPGAHHLYASPSKRRIETDVMKMYNSQSLLTPPTSDHPLGFTGWCLTMKSPSWMIACKSSMFVSMDRRKVSKPYITPLVFADEAHVFGFSLIGQHHLQGACGRFM